MKKISVVIITKNEEKNIEACLQSVQWANEIIIIDSGSTDNTLKICQGYNCKIINTEWLGFGQTKQLGVDAAGHDWILVLDADERISESLKIRIQKILTDQEAYEGYRIKRESYYLGKLIRYSGWQYDVTLRLFNKKFGQFNDKMVHESVKVNGKIGLIEESLIHHSYPDLNIHIDKINRYTALGAQMLFENGKRISLPGVVFRGLFKFFKMYCLQLGFLDRRIGFVLAVVSSYGVSLKYFKLWKLNH